jgi:hypothetical protein
MNATNAPTVPHMMAMIRETDERAGTDRCTLEVIRIFLPNVELIRAHRVGSVGYADLNSSATL